MLKQTVGWWLCVGGDIGRGCFMAIKLQSHKNFQRSAHKTVPVVNKQRKGASLEELVIICTVFSVYCLSTELENRIIENFKKENL